MTQGTGHVQNLGVRPVAEFAVGRRTGCRDQCQRLARRIEDVHAGMLIASRGGENGPASIGGHAVDAAEIRAEVEEHAFVRECAVAANRERQ